MAAGLNVALANSFLDTNFDDLWVQLHTGDPGSAGTANVAATSDREQYATDAASAGAKSNTAIGRWDSTDAGGETFTHISLWTASTSGTFRASKALAAPVAVSGGQPFEIAVGDLDISITPIAS
jgi:hypothetical protein